MARGILERDGAEVRRSEGENGGRRRSFIDNLRIDVPLDAAVMDLMLYTWLKGVKIYFHCEGTGQALQCACQKKRRTCVPHLRNVSNCWRFWVHKPVTGQNSRSPDTAVVAIVSTDVTLKERKFDCAVLNIGDRDGLMITS